MLQIDYGLNRAEIEKVNKYQELQSDLRETWDLQEIDILPVVVGATGLLKTNSKEYLTSIPGRPTSAEVQINAIKGSIKILKRALGQKFG